MNCSGVNAAGSPCEAPCHTVDETGFCPAHRPGGEARMQEIRSSGGRATAAKHASAGFLPGEITRVTTLEEAKNALAEIHIAVLTRRITDREGNAASKALAEWTKVEAGAQTQRLVGELQRELDAKGKEIEELRRQLAAGSRKMRVAV